MILVVEIILLVMGIFALAGGKLTLSKTRVVRGTPARFLGILLMLPFPLSFVVGLAVGATMAVRGSNLESLRWTLVFVELGILFGCVLLASVIGWRLADRPASVTAA